MSFRTVKLAILVLIVAIALNWIISDQEDEEVKVGYSVYDESGPRLTGNALFAFSRLITAPIIGPAIAQILLKLNRFDDLKKLNSRVINVDLYPFYYPVQKGLDFQQVEDSKSLEESISAYKAKSKYQSIEDYVQAYKSGLTDPVKIVDKVIESVRAADQGKFPLNAVIEINRDAALEEAKKSLDRWKNGRTLSLLDGIPVFVKDEVSIKGYNLTLGTTFMHKYVHNEKEDNIAVRRLRGAGAIIMGKTNMHEIGIGVTGYSKAFGAVRNPYNLERYTGGSSSGSAAVVSAGIVPLALGTDGGGSIRIPSALCGVVGIKPTFQRIPYKDRECYSVTQIGPITSNVKDAVIAYSILAGPDQEQPLSLNQPKPHFEKVFDTKDLSDLKIGIYPEFNAHVSDPAISKMLKDVQHKLELRGAVFKNVSIPDLGSINRAHTVTILTEMVSAMDPYWSKHKYDLSLETIINLSLGRSLTAKDFLIAQRIRRYASNLLKEIFKSVDVILLPATAIAAPEFKPDAWKYGESDVQTTGALMRHSVLANFLGLPSGVVKSGYNSENLPISVQVLSDSWSEHHIFRILLSIEESVESDPVAPMVHFRHFK